MPFILMGLLGCSRPIFTYGKNPEVVVKTNNLKRVKYLLIKENNNNNYYIDNMYKSGYKIDLNDNKTLVMYKKTNKKEEDFLLNFSSANNSLLNALKHKSTNKNIKDIVVNEKVLIYFFGVKNNKILIVSIYGLRTRIKGYGKVVNFIDVTNTGSVTSELYKILNSVKNKI